MFHVIFIFKEYRIVPELPDVEIFKQYFDATSLHQQVTDVQTRSKALLKGTFPSELSESLKGHSFVSTDRHGKYLFAHADKALVLVLHFGMTGYLKYFKDKEKDSPHDRFMITFENGFHLACDSQRKLGEIRLTENREDFIRGQHLGPDALRITWPDFRDPLSGSRASIKSALINQQILAGIGNVYSDEILFQAGLHPAKKARDLDKNQLKTLYDAMKGVLGKAIESRADPDKFPRSFIIPHRNRDGKCPKCSGAVKRDKIAGRTAYYCPQCQKQS